MNNPNPAVTEKKVKVFSFRYRLPQLDNNDMVECQIRIPTKIVELTNNTITFDSLTDCSIDDPNIPTQNNTANGFEILTRYPDIIGFLLIDLCVCSKSNPLKAPFMLRIPRYIRMNAPNVHSPNFTEGIFMKFDKPKNTTSRYVVSARVIPMPVRNALQNPQLRPL